MRQRLRRPAQKPNVCRPATRIHAPRRLLRPRSVGRSTTFGFGFPATWLRETRVPAATAVARLSHGCRSSGRALARGRAARDLGDRRRARARSRRARALRARQGEDRPLRARAPRLAPGRQADRRYGDHADESRRGKDDDGDLAHGGPRLHRRAGARLPARAVGRAGPRREGRWYWRRLGAGRPRGGHQPALHRRPTCNRRCQQPSCLRRRCAPRPRQRARYRPGDDLVAPLSRHRGPLPAPYSRRDR